MGTEFFKITEKGRVTRPTPFALMTFFALFTLSAIFIGQFTIVFLCSIPVNYILCTTLVTTPFRVVVSKIMHRTKPPIVKSPPSDGASRWVKNLAPLLKHTGIEDFEGTEVRSSQKDEGDKK